MGHDAGHALLLADDGTVYFVGTAKRGEDGDQSKARRQPKPVKPKKFSRMEGLIVVNVSSFFSVQACQLLVLDGFDQQLLRF